MKENKSVSVNRNKLMEALMKTNNTINKKYMHEVTANIRIVAEEKKLTIYATNYETYQKITIETISNKNEIDVVINGKEVLKTLEVLYNEEIVIEDKEGEIVVIQGKNKVNIKKINTHFPNHINKESYEKECIEKLKIDGDMFLYVLGKVKHSCASYKDVQNFAMKGVLIESDKEKIAVVSTDTKRLSYMFVKNENELDIQMIISKKTIEEVDRIFRENISSMREQSEEEEQKPKTYQEFEVFLIKDKATRQIDMIGFENQNNEFYTKVINSKFPNYRGIIKEYNSKPVKIPRAELIDYIRRLKNFCIESEFIISKNGIEIRNSDLGNTTVKLHFLIDIENDVQEEIKIGLNNSHIMDNVRLSNDEMVDFFIDSPEKPILIRNSEFSEVVMPYKL